MIFSGGSLRTCLLAILRSSDRSNTGNNNRLAIIASKRVPEIRAPSATVPPKLEVINTENPKNKTIEV